jgi:hypothetical protein
MSWIAVTDQGQIGAGTVLGIFEEPWGPNLPVNPLPSGAVLAIRLPNGATAKIDVIEVTASEAIIQLSNQAKWRIAKVAPKEIGLLPDTGGAPATYWVVKDQ